MMLWLLGQKQYGYKLEYKKKKQEVPILNLLWTAALK